MKFETKAGMSSFCFFNVLLKRSSSYCLKYTEWWVTACHFTYKSNFE